MSNLTIMLVLAAVLLAFPAPGHGTVLRVERDGSGDFGTIADAMNAAAVGDTILLGPGRYTEFAPFTTSGWTEDTYAAVTVDSLTLMGVDRDAVIIGPTEPDFVGLGPKGVATSDHLTHVTLRSVTVENTHDGAYLLGGAVVHLFAVTTTEASSSLARLMGPSTGASSTRCLATYGPQADRFFGARATCCEAAALPP